MGMTIASFLNQFYTGRYEGSFATGVAFGENPSTGDCRVCGSLASLVGLEQALKTNDAILIEHSIGRILLVHSVILSIGGIPLIYSGDELGLLNDYSYQQDATKQHDGRWVQRIPVTEQAIAASQSPKTPQYKIAKGLEHLIKIRQQNKIFGEAETQILETNNQHVFAYARHDEQGNGLLAICNFSENAQNVDGKILSHVGLSESTDLISQQKYGSVQSTINLAPYQVIWLAN